jgi:hypothetical protein
VLIAQVDAVDENGVRDPVVGRWYIAEDGAVSAYDEVATDYTDWPLFDFRGVTSATTMAVEQCADDSF